MVPSTYEAGKLYNVLPSGNRAPDSTGENSGYDQTRADFDFDRGSNAAATRVNADGLIEKYRENLLLQSNDFGVGPWANAGTTDTSGQEGYNGTNNAWLITKVSANGRMEQSVSSTGVSTLSVYAKANDSEWALIQHIGGGNPYAFFNLSTGEKGAIGGGAIDSKIESVGDGWCRLSIVSNVTITQVRIYPAEVNTTSATTGSIYIQSAQLESGMVATDYLESTSVTGKAGVLIDLPRIDYSSGAGALLLEPSRLQKTEYSEYFEGWNRVNSSVAVLNANTYTSPEGIDNAYKVTFTEGGGQSQIYKVLNGFTIGTKYTQSLYVKYISGSGENFQIVKSFGTAGVRCTFTNGGADLSVIAVGGTQADDFGKEPLANGWFRIWFTYASNAGDWEINISRNTGTGSDVYAIYGHQIEAGSYATSYIPNHGESGGVTRAADSCSVTGASDVIGQTEGTMFVEAQVTKNGRLFLIGATGNFIELITTSGGVINAFVYNGSTQADINGSTTFDTGDTIKVAFAYKANDFALYVNGTANGTDTSGAVPSSMAQIIVNDYLSAGYNSANGYKQLALFNERLSNAELAALTA